VLGGVAGWLRWDLALIALLIASALAVPWMMRQPASWLPDFLGRLGRRLLRVSPPPPSPPVFDLNPARVGEADRLVQAGRAALARKDRALAYSFFSAAIEHDFTNAAAWLGKSRATRSPAERRICLERARRIDLAHGFRSNHLPRWDTPVAEQISKGLGLRDLTPLYGVTIPAVNPNGDQDSQNHSGFRQQLKRWLEVKSLFGKA
jgi:hypothetical protein